MSAKPTQQKIIIFTIGHSVRPLPDFLALLKEYNIKKVIDIRTVPRSRYNPQFNLESLPHDLEKAGIGYVHMPGLGGLRHPRKDSPNTGLRNDSFRGYADYMQTQEFRENADTLIAMAKKEQLALMCAESLPWHCHRNLLSDALMSRGVEVRHIINTKSIKEHTLTPQASVEGINVAYPPQEQTFPFIQ